MFSYYGLVESGQKNTSIHRNDNILAGVMDTDDNCKTVTTVSLQGRSDRISEEDSAFTFKNNANILANRNCVNKMLLFETWISGGLQTSIIQLLSLSDYIDL